MSEEQKVELGFQPCFVNGRTTYKSYLVVAVNPTDEKYNAIGIKALGKDMNDEEVYKFHFWPSLEYYGLDSNRAFKDAKVYQRRSGLSVTGYTSVVATQAQAEKIIDVIKAQPQLQTAARTQIFQTLHGGFDGLKATVDEAAIKAAALPGPEAGNFLGSAVDNEQDD